MKSNHKNAIIGGLFAVVFLMAVGYAAFAQQLTINGTANITSTWDVRFDNSYSSTGTNASAAIVKTTGKLADGTTSASTAPTASLSYSENDTKATLSVSLTQPGDQVVFKLRPTNYSTGLKAKASGAPTLSGGTGVNVSGNTATKGHIQYTVSATNNTLQPNATAAASSYDEITVTVRYTDVTTNETNLGPTTATLDITRTYNQAN